MRFIAALAVLMLWPISAIAEPAPLPPGVTPSSADTVRGLYIHAVDDRGRWKEEIWFYQGGGRTVMFSASPPGPGEAAKPAFGEVIVGNKFPGVFRPDSGGACSLDGNSRNSFWVCFTGTVDRVPVHCRQANEFSFLDVECVSVDEGRTRGMRLDSKFQLDDGGQYHHFDVDRIDQGAAIDPAVFEAAPKSPAP